MPATLPFGISAAAVAVVALWLAFRFRGRAHDPKRSLIAWTVVLVAGLAIWAVAGRQ